MRETIVRLRERYRAVTAADIARWCCSSGRRPGSSTLGEGASSVSRCRSAISNVRAGPPGRRARARERYPRPGHGYATPTPALRQGVWRFLEPRRLLTTRHHVVGPDYLSVSPTATLYIEADRQPQKMRQQAVGELEEFFHPLRGPTGQGWPFGRHVYLSEIYEVLARVPGVDFVRAVHLAGPGHPDREQERDARRHRSGSVWQRMNWWRSR